MEPRPPLLDSPCRSLLEILPTAVFIYRDANFLYVNPALGELTGYSRPELMAQPYWQIAHPDVQQMVRERGQARQAGWQVPSRYEVKIVRKQGQIRWLDVSAKLIEFEGAPAVLGSAVDVTERKQAEEILHNVVSGVSTSVGENFLEALLVYLGRTLDVKYTFISRQKTDRPAEIATAYFYTAGQRTDNMEYSLAGSPCEQVFLTRHTVFFPQGVSRAFPAAARLTELEVESYAGIPLQNSRGRTIGVLGVMDTRPMNNRHFTESTLQVFAMRTAAEVERLEVIAALEGERASLARRVEARTTELSEANHKLARAVRIKDEFLANMSHELRTPLNAILGMTEILQEETPLSEQQARCVRVAGESAQHLLSLINDILDLAKIEAGKMELEVGSFDPRQLAESCLRIVRQTAHRKNLRLSLECDPQARSMRGDQRRLKQILVNLLSNAVKFTPNQGSISLRVETRAEQGVILFEVEDSGVGIPESELPRLFKPFEQMGEHGERQYQGTGLGLSLVHTLAALHGGSVSARSTPGKGSCFSVFLPWHYTVPEDETAEVFPEAEKNLRNASVMASLLANRKILVVEDNENNLKTLACYLQGKGGEILFAREGEEALKQARIHHPDLILMDVQMPGMNGLETTRHIRADAGLSAIPIIALTALVMPGDRERCLAAGMNDYVSKPINFKQLLDAIRKQF